MKGQRWLRHPTLPACSPILAPYLPRVYSTGAVRGAVRGAVCIVLAGIPRIRKPRIRRRETQSNRIYRTPQKNALRIQSSSVR